MLNYFSFLLKYNRNNKFTYMHVIWTISAPYPCGINEVYDSCPVCSEECSNKSPDGRRCRSKFRIGITVICEPKCRCIEYYWRNNNGVCVPYSDCRKDNNYVIINLLYLSIAEHNPHPLLSRTCFFLACIIM